MLDIIREDFDIDGCKIVNRPYFDENDDIQYGRFALTGQWSDGAFAYSRLDDNDEVIPGEDGAYYQIRYNGKLTMAHS